MTNKTSTIIAFGGIASRLISESLSEINRNTLTAHRLEKIRLQVRDTDHRTIHYYLRPSDPLTARQVVRAAAQLEKSLNTGTPQRCVTELTENDPESTPVFLVASGVKTLGELGKSCEQLVATGRRFLLWFILDASQSPSDEQATTEKTKQTIQSLHEIDLRHGRIILSHRGAFQEDDYLKDGEKSYFMDICRHIFWLLFAANDSKETLRCLYEAIPENSWFSVGHLQAAVSKSRRQLAVHASTKAEAIAFSANTIHIHDWNILWPGKHGLPGANGLTDQRPNFVLGFSDPTLETSDFLLECKELRPEFKQFHSPLTERVDFIFLSAFQETPESLG